MKFKPVYKDYIWGGRRLADRYGRDIPGGRCAESWEISAHPDGPSVVASGPLAGRSLSELARDFPAELLGTKYVGQPFPLLIKLIDAEQDLSVQVHPHDENAHLTGGQPKTEAWYILDCQPGAQLIAGLAEGVDREALREALPTAAVEALLRRIPVAPGDTVYMPGGRVHAICAGELILEVQQSSNTTYRLYDWGRRDSEGNPRELHIEQGLQVIRRDDDTAPKPAPELLMEAAGKRVTRLLRSPYFEIRRLELATGIDQSSAGESFTALFCERGTAEIGWSGGSAELACGGSALIPAGLTEYSLAPIRGECRLLAITG
jgi:mannose-6-phosphate isomerase